MLAKRCHLAAALQSVVTALLPLRLGTAQPHARPPLCTPSAWLKVCPRVRTGTQTRSKHAG